MLHNFLHKLYYSHFCRMSIYTINQKNKAKKKLPQRDSLMIKTNFNILFFNNAMLNS